jgi:hypothetical protein
MTNILRHGDIALYEVAIVPEGKKIEHKGSFVLALGETTGHKHVITATTGTMTIYETSKGERYIVLTGKATLSHEEHKTIVVNPKTYFVGHEREKDWMQMVVRKVID